MSTGHVALRATASVVEPNNTRSIPRCRLTPITTRSARVSRAARTIARTGESATTIACSGLHRLVDRLLVDACMGSRHSRLPDLVGQHRIASDIQSRQCRRTVVSRGDGVFTKSEREKVAMDMPAGCAAIDSRRGVEAAVGEKGPSVIVAESGDRSAKNSTPPPDVISITT